MSAKRAPSRGRWKFAICPGWQGEMIVVEDESSDSSAAEVGPPECGFAGVQVVQDRDALGMITYRQVELP
mgnify:CR=1 FL=1|jgi:hypothetical protein